ncbi:toxic anion resistance protein, partial [Thioclava sp. BHET1]
VRTQTERGIFDIEAVQKANDTLIATINESLQIAEDGRAKRAEAETKLTQMEHDLRDTLASAKARATGAAKTGG